MLVWCFATARYDAPILWAPPVWMRHTALTLMLASLILLGAYGFKKSHVAVAVHHPMVWAVAVWAFAHLLANGSVADIVLFGAFLVWAVLDLASAYRRDVSGAVAYPAPQWSATMGAVIVAI